MQNDSSEVIFLQQNNPRMEQTATVCHWFIISQRLQEPSWWNLGRYGHLQLKSYLAHQLQVQVQVQDPLHWIGWPRAKILFKIFQMRGRSVSCRSPVGRQYIQATTNWKCFGINTHNVNWQEAMQLNNSLIGMLTRKPSWRKCKHATAMRVWQLAKQEQLGGHGRARREAARRRKFECKINSRRRNSSRSKGRSHEKV